MPGRPYSETEREAGYRAIILNSGNCSKASEELAMAGINIPRDTLANWRRTRPKELEAAQERYGPEEKAKRAAVLERVSSAALEVLQKQIARADETVEDLTPRDAPGAARNLATTAAILTDKALILREQPNSISGHDYSSALSQLKRMGLVDEMEGTAEEIPDAVEIPEASSLPEGQPA